MMIPSTLESDSSISTVNRRTSASGFRWVCEGKLSQSAMFGHAARASASVRSVVGAGVNASM